jgi:hypothetical protein
MRRCAMALIIVLTTFASGAAHADGGRTGIELGLRTGYALPFGDASSPTTSTSTTGGVTTVTTGGGSVDKLITGQIPLWIDAGYRIIPSVYVGGFFQYGFGFIGNDAKMVCGQAGASCSTHDIMFGLNAHYHFLPSEVLDPWAGIGFGYEFLGFGFSQGGMSADAQAEGWQFVNAQVGADYHAAPGLGIGPFIALSFGQYKSASLSSGGSSQSQDIQHQSVHEWLTLGVRGAYDISIE